MLPLSRVFLVYLLLVLGLCAYNESLAKLAANYSAISHCHKASI